MKNRNYEYECKTYEELMAKYGFFLKEETYKTENYDKMLYCEIRDELVFEIWEIWNCNVLEKREEVIKDITDYLIWKKAFYSKKFIKCILRDCLNFANDELMDVFVKTFPSWLNL